MSSEFRIVHKVFTSCAQPCKAALPIVWRKESTVKHWNRVLCYAALGLAPLAAQDAGVNSYIQTNLVSDVSGLATHTDPNLINAWGIAFGGSGPWWVNAAETGLSLVYDGNGNPYPPNSPLVVTIPPPAGGGPSVPTGIVFNSTSDFPLASARDRSAPAGSTGTPALFLFASARGTISGWNTGTSAVLKVTTPGAVYLGLTLGQLNGQNVLYAANFVAGGTINAFDGNFNPISLPAGAFTDSMIPSDYAPFNVENIGGSIYVMFAEVGPNGDEVHGAGLGYVDKFGPDGTLQLRLQHGDWMNAPWGVAMAPSFGFGALSRRILVGQFGGGQIASFNARTGAFEGLMNGTNGSPVQIDGLWGIRFGNGGSAGSPRELFFAAGINDEADGLFGKLTSSGR
ncbi:MAG: TIGR03118 family protein [Terriglobia bacterium]|nr:MAG: TIGR03118 family protein [Terriglobia bacterium]